MISNVKVEVFHSPDDPNETPCAVTYSDENGYYKIEPQDEGLHYLRFTYGTYEENCSTERLKKSVKYNGLDYTAIMTGKQEVTNILTTTKTTYTTIEKTIIRSGSGCSQVVIALDISYSTWVDGNTALENEKEAAKELIRSLLDEQKNIYISIVVFAGGKNNASGTYVVNGIANTSNATSVRIISFTNNEERLIQAIDAIQVRGEDKTKGYLNVCDFIAGTNIEAGLQVAQDTFVKPPEGQEDVEYLKNIILLSDGAPTTDNNPMNEQIYSDDSDEVIEAKLSQIADNTHNKLVELVNDGVNVFSYVVESEDEYLQGIIEKIFNPRNESESKLEGKWFHSNEADAVEIIKTDIAATVKETIEKTQETIVDTETIEKAEELVQLFAGVENEERRNELTNYYNELNYENVSTIEKAFLDTTNEQEFRGNAMRFLDDTWMSVDVESPYLITKSGDVARPYTGQDLVLDEREKFELTTDIKVTGFRLTLSDGTILKEESVGSFCDGDLQPLERIQLDDIKSSPLAPIYMQSIDAEISNGATVEIEYTIIVKNETAVPAQSFTILNYLTNLSKSDTLSTLHYDGNTKMITDSYTNQDYGWKAKAKSELRNNGKLVSDSVWDNLYNAYYIESTYDCNNTNGPLRGGKLYSNGERYIKVVLSKVLSAVDEQSEFSDSVEIVKYKNDLGVRMRTPYTETGKLYKLYMGIIPGNGNESFSTTPVAERDYAEAMSVFVLPPTGIGRKYIQYILIAVVILVTCGIVTIKIRKKRK